MLAPSSRAAGGYWMPTMLAMVSMSAGRTPNNAATAAMSIQNRPGQVEVIPSDEMQNDGSQAATED